MNKLLFTLSFVLLAAQPVKADDTIYPPKGAQTSPETQNTQAGSEAAEQVKKDSPESSVGDDEQKPNREELFRVQDWDSRCNNIRGSDLCLMWERNSNYEGYLEVWYSKRSGPRRYIRLYVAGCGQAPYQVYEGYIKPGQTRSGAWDGYIYPGSCWVGYMRIGNARWTTGELYS